MNLRSVQKKVALETISDFGGEHMYVMHMH
jgi:hypothetical protein